MRSISVVGPEPEALHDARPEALDQRVGALGERQRKVSAGIALEIDRERLAPAQRWICRTCLAEAAPDMAIEPDHVGAHVGQQHPGKRIRADTTDLQHPDSGQRPDGLAHGAGSSSLTARF